jgi:hypothetical protein
MTRALLLVLAAASAGAQTGEVRGVVSDSSGGERLARIEIALPASGLRAITGAEGRFAIAGVPAGEHTLRVSTVGYRMLNLPFTLAAGESKEFEIALTPDVLRRTETVEVRAGPFEIETEEQPSRVTLGGTEAKNLASVLADDPLRAVQALPGVASNDDFDARFSIRGAGYHRVGLYYDGILMHSPFHTLKGEQSTGSMTVLNGDMIEEMTLDTGAFAARYADRTAAVLDIRPREGSRVARSVRATASASNAGVLAEGPLGRGRRGSWLAAARKSYLQYLIKRTSDDPTLAFGFTDAQGRVSHDLGRSATVTLSVAQGIADLDRSDAVSRLGANSLMLAGYRTTTAVAGWRAAPTSRLVIQSRGAWMRERYENRNRDSLALAAGLYGEWAWNTDATWNFSGAGALDAGWTMRRVRDNGLSNYYQYNPFAVRRLEDYRGHGLREGGYAEPHWSTPGGRVTLSAGVRWDRHSVSGQAATSPRASVAFAPFSGTRLRLGWGQYAQFPEIDSFFTAAGGRWLAPERATHAVAEIEQRLGERTRVRVAFYDRQDRDLLFRSWYDPRLVGGRILVPPAAPPIRNALRGYARGFEVFVQRRSANKLSGWVSYSYGHARLEDRIARTRFDADEDQRHSANAFVSYRVRPSVNLSVRWVSGSGFPVPGYFRMDGSRYYLAAGRNQVRLPVYHRADFRINKSRSFDRWKLTVYGEVINLLNHRNYRYDSFGGYNGTTGAATVRLGRMFPVIPSAGVMFER